MKFRPPFMVQTSPKVRKTPQNTWFTDPCCKSWQTGRPVDNYWVSHVLHYLHRYLLRAGSPGRSRPSPPSWGRGSHSRTPPPLALGTDTTPAALRTWTDISRFLFSDNRVARLSIANNLHFYNISHFIVDASLTACSSFNISECI